MLTKGQQVSLIEPAVMVPENDPVWTAADTQVLLCRTIHWTEKNKQLKEQLQIGVQLSS